MDSIGIPLKIHVQVISIQKVTCIQFISRQYNKIIVLHYKYGHIFDKPLQGTRFSFELLTTKDLIYLKYKY